MAARATLILEKWRLVIGQTAKRALRKSCSGFIKSNSGAVAVEFAIVSVPFMLILVTIMEVGLVLFTEYSLQNAVMDASRLVRTGQAQDNAYDIAKFKKEICDRFGTSNCSTEVNVYVNAAENFTDLKTKLPAFDNIGPDYGTGPAPSASFNCGEPTDAVAVIVNYDWKFVMPFVGDFFGNVNNKASKRLIGFAVFRNEPFNDGSACT